MRVRHIAEVLADMADGPALGEADMKQDPLAFREAGHKAMADPNLKHGAGTDQKRISRWAASYGAANYPDFEELARSRRGDPRSCAGPSRHAAGDIRSAASRRAAGMCIGRAMPKRRARSCSDILKEAGAKTVTKGKSMVTEEIELNPYLIDNGMTPIETDLGEYIIQLRDEPPSHIIAPAFHLNKEDVAETFRDCAYQRSIPRAISTNARRWWAKRAPCCAQGFRSAPMPASRAPIFSPPTEGAAVIVTNEGNGDLTRLLPKTHIVVTGIEKVVPDLNDVAVLLRLLTRSATGQPITSYVSVMSGPRAADETDGPENFHVVLVDNGRTRLIGSPAEETCAASAVRPASTIARSMRPSAAMPMARPIPAPSARH